MLYYLAFLLVALIASVLLFRLVALAATEIARVFLLLFLVFSPVTVFCRFVRSSSR
jgi:uncharacterized membrane protein YtjA (UPF0391 family)